MGSNNHMLIKYSTGQIPPKNSRAKGSQGKKNVDTTEATVDVSEESDPEPARKRTASRRVVKKKVTITAYDNIVPELDISLELGKSISLTEAAEEEATRQVYATHARIMTKPVPEPIRRRPSDIAFRDTSNVLKKMSSDPYQKLKGVHTLTHKEQIAADTMKALKESKKTSMSQPDFAFQIDYMQLKKGKGKNMPYPDTTEATVDVSEESDPKPARKRTASRRVVKKKVTITAYDNIVPEPDISLELGKSISLTEAAEEEATRQVYATHARIMTKPVPEPVRRRPSGIAFRDTSSVLKKMSSDPYQKLKGVHTLTPKEQIAADTMKALKESKKTSMSQPGTEGSSEGTGVSSGVLDESTIIIATSSEGTGTKPGVLSEEKVTSEANVILEWGSKQEINNDEDEKMTNAEVEESGNEDKEVTDAAKVDDGKTEEVKDDAKKTELPPTSSILSVSSGFSDQFLKLSSDTSLIGTIKDTTYIEINSLLDIKIQSKVPHIQSPLVLTVPVFMISEPLALTPIPKTPLVAPATTLLPHPSISTIPPVLLQITTPIPSLPITTEALTITTTVLESDVLTVV
nr:hypothetical protein [Tanacetum cinerariifolium]